MAVFSDGDFRELEVEAARPDFLSVFRLRVPLLDDSIDVPLTIGFCLSQVNLKN